MTTPLTLTPEQEEVLREACRNAEPREACGIISGGVVYELPNAAADLGSFRIRREDLQGLADKHGLLDLDAVWHTHPSGSPVASASDLASHPWPAALVIATRETVRVYRNVWQTPDP